MLAKVEVDYSTGCWNWRGTMQRNGYGAFYMYGLRKLSHRAMYELLFWPLDPAIHLHHDCKNKKCCNPSHLEPLSPSEHHIADGQAEKIRAYHANKAPKTHCPRNHAYEPDNYYDNGHGSKMCKICTNSKAISRRKRLKNGDSSE